jgi:hypothetical protein
VIVPIDELRLRLRLLARGLSPERAHIILVAARRFKEALIHAKA